MPGLFKGAVDGVRTYFAYANSQGGVNGRQLRVQTGDDQLSCTTEAGQVSGLAAHVFAPLAALHPVSFVDGAD